MAVIGYALVIVGLVSVVLGIVIGAKDAFTKMQDPNAQSALPDKFLDVLLELLKATPAKFFAVLGLILVVLGLALIGPKVFDSSDDDSDGAQSMYSVIVRAAA